MKKLRLLAKGTRKRYRHINSNSTGKERINILDRQFSAVEKNKVWLTDITYINTAQGFLYLAVFLDVFSRKVVGWSMSKRMTENLVIDAFLQAYGRENPDEGLLVHSDQGSQYASKAFQMVLHQHDCVQSMSHKGTPYDNAPMESFYRTLKRELVDDEHYSNQLQAQQSIFKYIELYYNPKRAHSTLGYKSPIEYERSS